MALTHDKDAPDPDTNLDDDPALRTYASVAEVLRGAREEHGQDLRTVAEILRIRFAYLEAIESGEFDRLPGTVYALGFLRTYAEFLGFDGDEIVEHFKEESLGAELRPELVFPEPEIKSTIPVGAIIWTSVLLLGVAYGGWFYLSNQGKSVADLTPPMPDRLHTVAAGEAEGAFESGFVDEPVGSEQAAPFTSPETISGALTAFTGPVEAAEEPTAPSPEPAAPSAEPAASAQDTVAGRATAAQTTAVVPQAPVRANETAPVAARPETAPGEPAPVAAQPETAPSEPAPARPAAALPASTSSEPANADPSPSEATPAPLEETVVIPSVPSVPQAMTLSSDRSPRTYGESTNGTRIVLRALQDSWVQVRDRQDALLLTRVLRAGDTYFVPAQEGLTLLTGNAGGIEIEVDGKAVQSLGPVGAIRRKIALDPARLLNGTASPR